MEDTDGRHSEIKFKIDRHEYETIHKSLTGAMLRDFPQPPVGAERDLYQVRPGDDDVLIGDTEPVHMRDGLRFYTAPGHINPGAPGINH